MYGYAPWSLPGAPLPGGMPAAGLLAPQPLTPGLLPPGMLPPGWLPEAMPATLGEALPLSAAVPVRPSVAPLMGGQFPGRRGRVTQTVAEGVAGTCVRGGQEFRYAPGVTVEILRSWRTREGIYYLVMTTDGCVGWVPADHLDLTPAGARGAEV